MGVGARRRRRGASCSAPGTRTPAHKESARFHRRFHRRAPARPGASPPARPRAPFALRLAGRARGRIGQGRIGSAAALELSRPPAAGNRSGAGAGNGRAGGRCRRRACAGYSATAAGAGGRRRTRCARHQAFRDDGTGPLQSRRPRSQSRAASARHPASAGHHTHCRPATGAVRRTLRTLATRPTP